MITSSVSSLTFGSVLVGASDSQAVTLTNTGTTTVDITSITSTSAVFTIGTNCGELRSKHACTITVTFRPTSAGASAANLQIFFHPQASLLRIPMAGVGVVPKHKDSKEGKEAKEAVVDKNPRETKGVASERLAQPVGHTPGVGPPAAEASPEDAVEHAFITPQERPDVGPKEPECTTEDEKPESPHP